MALPLDFLLPTKERGPLPLDFYPGHMGIVIRGPSYDQS